MNLRNWEQSRKQKRQTVITDVVLFPTPKGSFEYLTSPIEHQGESLISLEQIVKYKLESYYGASNIRKRLNILSSQGITLILDWYHLCKKLRELLSMIARNKSENTEHSKFLFTHLWRGNVTVVLVFVFA